jgi:hypothetical protein
MTSSRRFELVVFCAALFAIGAVQWRLWGYTAEDSFITFRYVANALDGKGLVFNPGEHVEGFSSPLYILLLVALGALHRDVVALSRVVGLLSTLGTVAACWVIARDTSRSPRAATFSFALAAATLVATPPFHMYATLGMETPLFMCLVTWAVAVSARARGAAPSWPGVLLFALVGIARPEGPLYAGLWFAGSWWRGQPEGAVRPRWRGLAVRALVCAAPSIAYEAFRWRYYGGLVPNVYFAKPIGFMRFDPHGAGDFYGLAYLLPWLAAAAPLLLGVAVLWTRDRGADPPAPSASRRLVAHAAGPVLAALIFVAYTQGDWFMFGRYLLPVWPLTVATLATALAELAARLRGERAWSPVAAGAVVIVAMAASVGVWTRDLQAFDRDEGYATLMKGQEQLAAGEWLAKTFPEPLEVGVCSIGGVGFAARQHLLRDICGLTDRDQARWIASGVDLPFAQTPVGQRRLDVVVLNLLDASAGLDNYADDYVDYLRQGYVCAKRFRQGAWESMDFWIRRELAEGKMLDCDLSLDESSAR